MFTDLRRSRAEIGKVLRNTECITPTCVHSHVRRRQREAKSTCGHTETRRGGSNTCSACSGSHKDHGNASRSRWLVRIETHQSLVCVPFERLPTCSGTYAMWAAAGKGRRSVAGSAGACYEFSHPSAPLLRVPSSTRRNRSQSWPTATAIFLNQTGHDLITANTEIVY